MEVKHLINNIASSAKESKSLSDLIDEALIPQGVDIPKPESILELNGIPVFTKKSISTLVGKAKSGKTTVTSWLASRSISNLKVLWVDTEQGQYYASRTQHWILLMAGMTTSENLKFYDLKIHNPNKRVEMIQVLIEEYKPDIVIIDGIRDLVFDINSPEEATLMLGDLMRWAEEFNCHILSILHLNKGNDSARGHLGTEMINKSETVMKVELEEDKRLIVCSPEYTRSEPFQSFAFDRDDRGIPQIVDGFSGKITTKAGDNRSRQINPSDYELSVHKEIISQAFKGSESLSYGELQNAIIVACELYDMPIGVGKSKVFIQHYLQQEIVLKIGKDGKKSMYIPKQ
ncbi:AAA family ATPase [Olivibacter sp. LS-1]|uniref:AAA family ATPase n=1 Tax=Olivibacter sp. LS-1 TaxID=2592345 RepID=UPI0011EB5E0B|nr:AAA family ATPase [Olivibacter sp. LS-1]QEL01112.1 AAA family ATPase [Olivibacter sp. LS-1]